MQFTVMPNGPSSCAICRVNPICAALALAYAWIPVRLTLRPAPDEMFTIDPARAAFIPGMTARVQRNALVRFASTIARHSSSLTSSRGLPTWPTTPPALLTSTSMRPSRLIRLATCLGSERSAVSRSTRWTFAPSSSSPFAIAVPIPCAVPVTSATFPVSSPIFVPPVLDEVAHFRDAGPPKLEHLRVGALVRAAKAPVDGEAAQLDRSGLADDALRYERLCAFRHGDPRQACPRKVLHPRAVRGFLLVALNDRPGARRVPPVVEQHLDPLLPRLGQPFAHHTRGERIAAVAVHHRNAPKALAEERIEKVADDGDVRAGAQRWTSGKRREVRRHAERQSRQYRDAERFGRFDRDALGEDRVGPDRQVTVLFRGSDRQDDPIVVLQVFLEHLPVAVMDSHERLPRPSTRSRAIAYGPYGFGETVTAT